MPIIIDARETRPEVLELVARFERGTGRGLAPRARLRAALAAFAAWLRRPGGGAPRA